MSVYIISFFTVLFWASAFPGVKFAMRYYSPESVMLLRFLVASALLGGYCLITKTKPPARKDLPRFLLASFFGIFLYMWLFNTGTGMISSGLASFIIASCPMTTLVMSIVFLKERAGLRCWAGILLSFAGLALITSTQMHGFSVNFGVVLLLCATVCTSAYNIFQRDITKRYKTVQATAYCILFATAFMLVFLPRFVQEFHSAPMQANLVIVYLGVFPAALSYLLWGWALSIAEKTVQVTSFLYLSPFIAATISFFWLGERLEPLVLLGGIIVIAGLVLANLGKTASIKSEKERDCNVGSGELQFADAIEDRRFGYSRGGSARK